VQILHCQIDVLLNGLIGKMRPSQFLTIQFNAANLVPNSYNKVNIIKIRMYNIKIENILDMITNF